MATRHRTEYSEQHPASCEKLVNTSRVEFDVLGTVLRGHVRVTTVDGHVIEPLLGVGVGYDGLSRSVRWST
ncbi:hypothetical protein NDU88_000122 [Pleurodeles waltl]|uniref:Uncharacterized protein n=1 Tax=Pleurodeles waltl TaxID=8319 RepID=A0AAV7L999_PLEWA|nr:hypothetical protein NDU88_000122 [Pleurodeles waltl]